MSLNAWHPKPVWQDKDCFVIGGGISLTAFYWQWLIPEYVIGCNDAYRLGEGVVNICIFGDNGWFQANRDELAKFKNIVVTNRSATARCGPKWMRYIPRKPDVLYTDALGWGGDGGNTGISAINLALMLGCTTVYLLGFDCKRTRERCKWHNRVLNPKTNTEDTYDRFYSAFCRLAQKLPEVYPGRQIININNDSRLDMFPTIAVGKFFQERREAALAG
jgi:hypothetical protein